MHGHIEELIDAGVERIFYPCLSYNVDEHASDNHYNCPVVAYYAELLHGNMDRLKEVDFLYPYLSVENPRALTETCLLYTSARRSGTRNLYSKTGIRFFRKRGG